MSEPVNPDPTEENDSDQPLPTPPVKQPDEEDPPMEPNPYMGGGSAPA